MFARGSRYENVPNGLYVDETGRQIPYKLMRQIPNPPGVQAHLVTGGDRLDLLSFNYFDDPEQFWRICDANQALWPDDLTAQPGRRLLIPLATR